MLLLLIFHKAYTSTLQRLFLYLTILTVIQEACATVSYYTIQFEYSEHETFCDVINNVWQWSNTVGYLLTLAMIVFLPYKIYEQFKGDPFPRLSKSKCCRIALECLFIFIVLVLPLTYIYPWAYCELGQWCSIDTMDLNCTFVVNAGQNLMLYFNLFDLMGMIGMVFTIVLSVVFCCLACKYRETRQPFLKTLCRTLILLGLFVASTAVTVLVNILLPTELVVYPSEWYIYQLVKAVVLPVFQLTFPVGFLFYLYSFNLFRWRAIKRAAAEWRCFRSCCERENAQEEAATAPRSHRVPAPSVTFFDEPHSRVTTDVRNEEQQALLPDGGGGRGHGSIMNS